MKASFSVEPPTPGTPVFWISLSCHFISAHSESASAARCPTSRRSALSSQAAASSRVSFRASWAISLRNSFSSMMSAAHAEPRSKRSVTFVMRQPSFSLPTSCSTGMRTSVRNISAKSLSPCSVGSGRTSMPGRFIGMMSQLMPRCFGALGFVRTSISQ